jgi:hypothetical protein
MIGSAAPVLRRPAEATFPAFLDFTDARDFFFTIRFRILPPFHRGRVALRASSYRHRSNSLDSARNA